MITENKDPVFAEFPKAHLDAAKKDAALMANKADAVKDKPRWDFAAEMGGRMDAGESAFLSRQLEHIRAGVYDIEYPELKGARLVPTNTSVPSGKETYTIRIMDKVGAAQVVSDDADDVPNVEISGYEKSMRMFTIALGYQYTIQEARAAQTEGVAISAKKAMVCRELMERKLDEVTLLGDAKAGVLGLLNSTDAGILTYNNPVGTGGLTTFASKGPDEILNDLYALSIQAASTSKEVFQPNTLLLPLSVRMALMTRRVGDGTSVNILPMFMANDPYITLVEGMYQLESNVAWTGRRAIAYRRDPNALELIVSQPFEQLAPQVRNFRVETLTRMRTGGLAIYQPATIVRIDNI